METHDCMLKCVSPFYLFGIRNFHCNGCVINHDGYTKHVIMASAFVCNMPVTDLICIV